MRWLVVGGVGWVGYGIRYHRMNLLLPEEIPMDDPTQIPILCELARAVDISGIVDWVRKYLYNNDPSQLEQ
jgi:hypothetical protein